MHGTYVEFFPSFIYEAQRRGPEIFVYGLCLCNLTNTNMPLDKFSAGAWLNLARKTVKFQREMAARHQRLRLWTAALIFLMNIVAKVFRGKISTDSYSPW